MNEVTVNIAIGDYDHTRDLARGRLPVAGARLRPLHLEVEEIFARFSLSPEWDVSEFSFGKFVARVAAGDTSLVGLPVFPSRAFRHASIFVREDSSFEQPEDLAGRRIGIPEWAQTASIYTRGILHHLHGVRLDEAFWVQAGVNQPGRKEKVDIVLPEGVQLERIADQSLNSMLLAGELDAVLSARPPAGFTSPEAPLRRLLSDYVAAERGYFEQTGVFPIMHLIVMRADLHHQHPWLAGNLMAAFEASKRASIARLAEPTASLVPLPWIGARVEEARSLFGEDPWPYGIGGNRVTLETFLAYAYEQGVCRRLLEPEELFAPSTLAAVRV